MTTAESVRQALREARSAEAAPDSRRKIEAVRRAVGYAFPIADIDRMLEEMQRGYPDRRA